MQTELLSYFRVWVNKISVRLRFSFRQFESNVNQGRSYQGQRGSNKQSLRDKSLKQFNIKINHLKFRRSRLFKEGNKKQKKNDQYYSINNSYFNIPICQVNLFGFLTHNTPLIKYAKTKLTIPKIKLTVNKTSLVFLFSILMGKITAAPIHPAARFTRKSAVIPKAILSTHSSYQQWNNATMKQWQRGFIKFSKNLIAMYLKTKSQALLIIFFAFSSIASLFLFNPFGTKETQAAWLALSKTEGFNDKQSLRDKSLNLGYL